MVGLSLKKWITFTKEYFTLLTARTGFVRHHIAGGSWWRELESLQKGMLSATYAIPMCKLMTWTKLNWLDTTVVLTRLIFHSNPHAMSKWAEICMSTGFTAHIWWWFRKLSVRIIRYIFFREWDVAPWYRLWCDKSSDRSFMVDQLSYLLFQSVFPYWCNKSCGMCYPFSGMVHIKDSLLLIKKPSIWTVLYHMSDAI